MGVCRAACLRYRRIRLILELFSYASPNRFLSSAIWILSGDCFLKPFARVPFGCLDALAFAALTLSPSASFLNSYFEWKVLPMFQENNLIHLYKYTLYRRYLKLSACIYMKVGRLSGIREAWAHGVSVPL